MLTSAAQFKALYPEFARTPDAKILSVLLEAQAMTFPGYGAVENLAHGLLTAHLLAVQPYARDAKLGEITGQSAYGEEYLRLASIWAAGRVPVI